MAANTSLRVLGSRLALGLAARRAGAGAGIACRSFAAAGGRINGASPSSSSSHGGRKGSIVCITSGKGGVGKTTTAASIACGLAERGHKSVVIDFDIGLRNLDVQ
jgi:Mrp family chromosome partitioning ATPase